jgi:hypothetical protein
MMRKLPDCPRCQSDELWLRHWNQGFWFEVACYLRGWHSGDTTYEVGVELDAAIATVVKAAQEPVSNPIASNDIT